MDKNTPNYLAWQQEILIFLAIMLTAMLILRYLAPSAVLMLIIVALAWRLALFCGMIALFIMVLKSRQ